MQKIAFQSWLLLALLFLSCAKDKEEYERQYTALQHQDGLSGRESLEHSAAHGYKQGQVPVIKQDGSKILSRHALGFARVDPAVHTGYQLEVITHHKSRGEEKNTANYVLAHFDPESENCRATYRREDEIVSHELDCLRTPAKLQSRFFEFHFTRDDLVLFAQNDCRFSDLGQQDILGFSGSRHFSVVCNKKGNEVSGERHLEVKAWFHPDSIHPSGLVSLESEFCQRAPCATKKTYFARPRVQEWTLELPQRFKKDECPYKPNPVEQVVRCKNGSCFDASYLGYSGQDVCSCFARLANVPVKWGYLSAQALESSASFSLTQYLDFSSQESCMTALQKDVSCAQCFML